MPTLEEIHLHVDNAGGDDPRLALIAVRKLLLDDLPFLERRAVQMARREWWGWAPISRLLARSRQAVRQKHNGIERDPAPTWETSDVNAFLNAAAERYFESVRARAGSE
jgi:hypothetical protein